MGALFRYSRTAPLHYFRNKLILTKSVAFGPTLLPDDLPNVINLLLLLFH